MSAPVLLDVGTELAAHLAIAVRAYRKSVALMGLSQPPGLLEIEAHFAKVARRGPDRTDVDRLEEVHEGFRVAPRLLTFAQVGGALQCHERTVRRLVASGALRKVKIGGAPRVRVVDLDGFLDQLAQEAASA